MYLEGRKVQALHCAKVAHISPITHNSLTRNLAKELGSRVSLALASWVCNLVVKPGLRKFPFLVWYSAVAILTFLIFNKHPHRLSSWSGLHSWGRKGSRPHHRALELSTKLSPNPLVFFVLGTPHLVCPVPEMFTPLFHYF